MRKRVLFNLFSKNFIKNYKFTIFCINQLTNHCLFILHETPHIFTSILINIQIDSSCHLFWFFSKASDHARLYPVYHQTSMPKSPRKRKTSMRKRKIHNKKYIVKRKKFTKFLQGLEISDTNQGGRFFGHVLLFIRRVISVFF